MGGQSAAGVWCGRGKSKQFQKDREKGSGGGDGEGDADFKAPREGCAGLGGVRTATLVQAGLWMYLSSGEMERKRIAQHNHQAAHRQYDAPHDKRAKDRCSKCRERWYCSAACQIKDWKLGHRFNCNKVVQHSPIEQRLPRPAMYVCLDPPTTLCHDMSSIGQNDVVAQHWAAGTQEQNGLVNIKNTCYINSVVQVLASLPAFLEAIYAMYAKSSKGIDEMPLTVALLSTLAGIVDRRDLENVPRLFNLGESGSPVQPAMVNALAPIPLLQAVMTKQSTMVFGQQEDAHELFQMLMHAIIDELAPDGLPKAIQETTSVHQLFRSIITSQLTCPSCGYSSSSFESHLDLQLEIEEYTDTLEEMLEAFTCPEQLDKSNKYRCAGCDQLVRAHKQLSLYEAPNVLAIQLKRFRAGAHGRIDRFIQYPHQLNLKNYMTPGHHDDGKMEYELCGIIIHLTVGNLTTFGHYVSVVKQGSGDWLLCNDTYTSVLAKEDIEKTTPYMLFYKRREFRPLPTDVDPAAAQEKEKGKCKSGCGFFGAAEYGGHCSKCFKALSPVEQDACKQAAVVDAAQPNEPAAVSSRKVGRNEKCPCNSGRKYKACHGKQFYVESNPNEAQLAPAAPTHRNKDKQPKSKTLTLGLILCLNIGVTPPDVVRTHPCAKLEAWIDPEEKPKAIELISQRLTSQYLRWQPKAKFRQAPDPTLDEVKRLCLALRRRAKDECVLLHFNGHGVPRPTANGELWLFNKDYTQYLPASIYDIQSWVGAPTIFVYDCSGAGILVEKFNYFAQRRKKDIHRQPSVANAEQMQDCLQLAACRADESLPTSPDYPADLFTACLTTPVEMALRWVFTTKQQRLLPHVTLDMLDDLPGQLSDRTTMRGSLNWIFTAVTDTIAWEVLPISVFQRIFRNDLLAAALFRNFLLAVRIMRDVNCTPVSEPPLPQTHDHPMWEAWDCAVDFCLAQLPAVVHGEQEFQEAPFFNDQMTAFSVWLDLVESSDAEVPKAPEQLPILLQVLLSQPHRLRALELLNRFMSLAPWAVEQTLAVGIFPYVFKLLSSLAVDLQEVLVSIWARILVVDRSRKQDLLKPPGSVVRRSSGRGSDKAFMYFVNILKDAAQPPALLAAAAFILVIFLEDHPEAQDICLRADLIAVAAQLLDPAVTTSSTLRKWVALLLGKLFNGHEMAQREARSKVLVVLRLTELLHDSSPQTRAATVYALGHLICGGEDDVDMNVSTIGSALISIQDDGSHVVRMELAASLSPLVVLYTAQLIDAASALKRADSLAMRLPSDEPFILVLKSLLLLATDPFPAVAETACTLLAHLGIRATRKPMKLREKPMPSRPRDIASSPATPTLPGSPGFGAMSLDGLTASSLGPHSPMSLASSYVSLLPSARAQMHQPVRDDLRDLVELLATTAQQLEEQEQGMDRDPREALSSICLQLRRITEAAPSIVRQLQGLADAGQPGTNVGLRLAHTNFARTAIDSFCLWQHNKDSDAYAKAEDLDWRRERSHDAQERAGALVEAPERLVKPVDAMFHKLCTESFDMLAFHPHDTLVAAANKESGNVHVYDMTNAQPPVMFSSKATKHGAISSIKVINPDLDSLLLTGYADGTVRLWRDWSTPNPGLHSAWRAVSKMRESSDGVGAGLVLEWDQSSGQLIATGDINYLQIWDARSEMRTRKLSSNIDSCITSLCIDRDDPQRLLAGYGNGLIRLFDLRHSDDRAVVQQYSVHQDYIVSVHSAKESERMMSGSRSGQILWWDYRYPGQPIRTMTAHRTRGDVVLQCLDTHDYAPIFATANSLQQFKIFNKQGQLLHHHKHYTNFLGEAIGPITALKFHPYEAKLGVSSLEKLLTVYSAPC
ncbi:uncharacterized protein MONBRDRAFT_27441 [Monosiga brevicollis MX1]|uniref:Uncharacterized protein n=1 Tax=Monosiga brevicollis TaxID=81824 RepID=A9V5A2_MONBE|nr:uncharacterized protein MONBRDRAFT_27441 [Monosiga brevicollis MX1]EDQ87341.1 predicted protein [Monosiga brevicollis MX1]|eukprot:XP_001747954.1 hypothetical protein [Monosiga brevicollis MX1]